jgi:hypothetical protein
MITLTQDTKRIERDSVVVVNLFDLAAGAIQALDRKSEWESPTIGFVPSLSGPCDPMQVLEIAFRQ